MNLLPAMLAIQTRTIQPTFNGNHHRSRNEARWAVFLDEILDNRGTKYIYEPDGFDLAGIWYLPDFEVPEWDSYLEIKSTWPPTRQELDKAIRLCIGKRKNVYILAGQPWPGEYRAMEFSYLIEPSPYAGATAEKLRERFVTNSYSPNDPSVYYHLPSMNEVMLFREVAGYEKPFPICTYNLKMSVLASEATFAQCRKCQAISLVTYFDIGICRKCWPKWASHAFVFDKDGFKLFCGFYRARQARFEHGERP